MAKNVLQKTDEELLKEKTGFLLYKNYYDDYCDGFTYEEMGKLFYCICFYERFRIEPNYPDRSTELLFKKIKNNLDLTDKEWLTTTKTNAINGAKHKGNQYTRIKEKENYVNNLIQQMEQNGTPFQNNDENGTPFQKSLKNGTNGTDTDTDTDTDIYLSAKNNLRSNYKQNKYDIYTNNKLNEDEIGKEIEKELNNDFHSDIPF